MESWFMAGKLILISNNCPPLRKSEIEYYAMLAKVGVHHFNGSKYLISLIRCTMCCLFRLQFILIWFVGFVVYIHLILICGPMWLGDSVHYHFYVIKHKCFDLCLHVFGVCGFERLEAVEMEGTDFLFGWRSWTNVGIK